ncbi:MAG: hypothetical protein GKR95_04055 [Gammaproteobacteria bacterium]|nr:hypothetical protein [Gammaproteobacteria bacterium]
MCYRTTDVCFIGVVGTTLIAIGDDYIRLGSVAGEQRLQNPVSFFQIGFSTFVNELIIPETREEIESRHSNARIQI